ncbi:MAG TPA: GIY-YIG nuclease family protein [Anaerolineae bacterium]|nr:GIY-YIG nuclease family protein [Anaerolineae bacterium]
MPYVYIVECVDGSLYTGWTVDVVQRVKVHNAGRGARYTRMHGPVKLVYAEEQPDRVAAQKRELEIKRWPREKKLKLINSQSSVISDQ